MAARQWLNLQVVGVGEAMLEFAPAGEGLYRRGFAGDTLNTCWHMAQLLGDKARVGYLTRVGVDAFSQQLVDFIAAAGIDASAIQRDPERGLGLYVIALQGAERSFSYWRETSAARRLADDPAALDVLSAVGLIHVSGITLAVIGETGRANLFAALRQARAAGAFVAFDPNVRPRLWPDEATLRGALKAMFALTDIALPSFDDEARLWGDATPEATRTRLGHFGVGEIAVKNGADDVVFACGDDRGRIATPKAERLIDTTGAGDAFNAGYLSARLMGMAPAQACRIGQRVAAAVIGHLGALAPPAALAGIGADVRAIQGYTSQ